MISVSLKKDYGKIRGENMGDNIKAAVLEIAKGFVEGLKKAEGNEKGVTVYISPSVKLILIGILQEFIDREDNGK